MVILIVVAFLPDCRYPKDLVMPRTAIWCPSGFSNVLEMDRRRAVRAWPRASPGRWMATKFFPIVMTIFLFIVISNWIGLLPGVGSIGYFEHPPRAGTATSPTASS